MKLTNLKFNTKLQLSFGLLSLMIVGLTTISVILMGGADSRAFKFVVGFGLIALIVSFFMSWWVSRSISLPLQEATSFAKRMASGDLREQLEVNATGELGELQLAMKEMSERIFKIVIEMRLGTTAVSGTSGSIAAGNSALSARTESQASSLKETASTLEELTSNVKLNAGNAQQANKLVASASELAINGGQIVTQVVATMASIKDSSRKIVDIISVIDGIAFQTNILALNAAVEAARAGEDGRGFAVVAAEVRNLAQRSATAAKEIKGLISDSVDKVNAGSLLVDEAGVAMNHIVAGIKRVLSRINEIAAASAEQSTGIEEINKAVVQFDGMTQKNAALVEESSRTANGLYEQTVSLIQTVSIFNFGAREFGSADEAVDLVLRAKRFAEKYGLDALIAEVNKFNIGQFIDRDLYITVYGLNGKVSAHGSNRLMLGVDWTIVKDSAGKFFCNEMAKIARSAGSGWVDYKGMNPLTKEAMTKSGYLERLGEVFLVCGFYWT